MCIKGNIPNAFGRLCFAAVSVMLTAMISIANGGTSIDYGDFAGATVTFIGVTESSLTDDVPLYGKPTVGGDTLSFGPVGFGSYSADGSVDTTDGQLSMDIEAAPGEYIDQIYLDEAGDVTMQGIGSAAAYASVNIPGVFLRVDEVDGTPIGGVSDIAYMVFSPSDGDWTLADDGQSYGGSLMGLDEVWEGRLTVDVTALLQDAGISGRATKMYITWNNRLRTMAEVGIDEVLISKKLASVRVTTQEIPEPATLVLLAIGSVVLLLAASLRRRKR